LLRYLIDCICAALNPPCLPCEDSAVKLACLTVEDCEVVRICNLERTFVLSGPAIRYWVPFLHAIGELFEKACCDIKIKLPQRDPRPQPPGTPQADPTFVRGQNYMATTSPTYRFLEGRPQLAALFQVANLDENTVRSAVNLAGNLGSLALVGRDFTTTGFDFDMSAIGPRMKDAALGAVIEQPQLREALVGPVRIELIGLREQVEAVRKRNDALEKRLAKLEKGG
jgi:hypothetical protein